MPDAVPNPNVITVSSGVSSRTSKGFITINFGDGVGQLDIAAAIEFGNNIIQAAIAAEYDALVYQWMTTGENPQPPNVAAEMLVQLRQLRGISPAGSATTSQTFEDPDAEI